MCAGIMFGDLNFSSEIKTIENMPKSSEFDYRKLPFHAKKWTDEEHGKFKEGVRTFGRDWGRISKYM